MFRDSLENLGYLLTDLKRVWAPRKLPFGMYILAPLFYITVWNIISYRIGRSLWLLPSPLRQIMAPVRILQKRFIQLFTSTDISEQANIGPGFFIAHNGPVVLGKDMRAGKNFFVRQGVTVGGDGVRYGHATFGDNVMLGANAVVLGPLNIGSDVIIGANAVVTKDIPPNSVAVGVPAKVMADKSGRWVEILGDYDK